MLKQRKKESSNSRKLLKVDGKGRLHIPKEIRRSVGIKEGEVSAKIEGQSLVIEPISNPFDRLASVTKFNFKDLDKALPQLRKAAEDQGVKEVS